ncbi:hypothetical protein [Streptomyces sp. SHP 1-2]|uniref:hypothetical protein n=1 Tax=Streptomyces sp. SHP 1-2 TaxID=2769489 RepID=UPI002237DCBF|nr:hypothetical protein [Streptomyces sp. SHP 1-2]MCW5254531.1 hypothetical protein [Streptomyces sp. SHP 1-2]
MPENLRNPASQLLSALLLAGFAASMWAAWLGWDQLRDVHPDGTETGPYQTWQVVGLGLSLLLPLAWAAARRLAPAAVLGPPLGLALAAYYDWSDDSSGLFAVGVFMIAVGSFLGCGFAATVIHVALSRRTARGHGH